MPVRVTPPRGSVGVRPGSSPGVVVVAPPRAPGTRTRKKGGGGPFGFVTNLAGDVEQAAVGIGPGLVQAGKAVGSDVAAISRDVAKHPEHALEVAVPVLGEKRLVETAKKAGKTKTYRTVVKPIVESYAETYGPLAHGDVGEFAHRFYEHPLGPILDVLTVATLGAGAAAKTGKILSKVGAISKESKLARLGEPGEIVLRSPAARAAEEAPAEAGSAAAIGQSQAARAVQRTSRNPLIRGRQQTVDRLLKQAPAETPVIGEFARAARQLRRSPDARKAVMLQTVGGLVDQVGALSRPQRRALALMSIVPLREHLDAWRGTIAREADAGNAEAGRLLRDVDDPKVQKAYEQPTKRMLRAHEEIGRLGGLAADELERLGVLTPERRAAAPYRQSRLAAGAEVRTAAQAKTQVRAIDKQLRANQKAQAQLERLTEQLRGRGTTELRQLRRQAGLTASQGSRLATLRSRLGPPAELERQVDELRSRLAETNDELARLADSGEVDFHKLAGAQDDAVRLAHDYEQALTKLARFQRLPGEGELAAAQADELAALTEIRSDIAGRLTAGRAEIDRLRAGQQRLEAEREGIEPSIVGGPTVDELRQQIEAAGRPQPAYLPEVPARPRARTRSSVFGYSSPIHQSEGLLFLTGRLALDPMVLSPYWTRVALYAHWRDLHDLLLESAVRVPVGRGSRANLQEGWVWVRRPAGSGELPDLRGLIENPDDFRESRLAQRGLTTETTDDAYIDFGHRYAVPARLARQLEAEFRRSSRATRLLWDKPTQVWRTLVLHGRVGFLTNNVVGNHLLYALLFSGRAGLRGYLAALRTTKGAGAVRRLLDLPETRSALTAADIRELFPAQAAGTFVRTQQATLPMPERLRGVVESPAGNRARRGLRSIATANAANEGMLRRAAVNAAIRKSPEIRARLARMEKDTRSLRDAARVELEHNPQLADEISRQVDQTLGSYLNASSFERQVLRRAVPFASWYRAILQITGRLVVDRPFRANLLDKLALVGNEISQDQLGPVPSYLEGAIPLDDQGRVLRTTGLNPLETIPQLGRAAGGLLPGGQPTELGRELNPFLQAVGTGVFGGEQGRVGLPADILMTVGENLPQTRLARAAISGPPPSRIYRQPTALEELYAFLGAPVRTINRGEARRQHRAGQ